MFIQPKINKIIIAGKLLLYDGRRHIIIKKALTEAFPDLKQRIALNYVMEQYFEKDLFMEKITKCLDQGVLPILLFFEKQ